MASPTRAIPAAWAWLRISVTWVAAAAMSALIRTSAPLESAVSVRSAARKILQKMNYDKRFKLTVA